MPDLERESEPVRGAEFLNFAGGLCACTSFAELERRYMASVGRLEIAPKYAFYLFDRDGCEARQVAAGVSELFLARYERDGRKVDPLFSHVLKTGRIAHNLALMSIGEWRETPLYRQVSHIHRMHHVIEAPVISGGSLVGTLNFATSEDEPGLTARDVRVAEALGRLVGRLVEGIEFGQRLRRDHEHAQLAMELTGSPIAITDPEAPRPRLNEAARGLMSKLVGGEEHLFGLLTLPGVPGPFARHLEVELADGGRGVLHAYSRPSGGEGTLVTVLELRRDNQPSADHALIALTPREREVALLVAEGFSDRKIAERLHLSRHTVSQYVKRCYRKLEVGSRVELTRLVLGHGVESTASTA